MQKEVTQNFINKVNISQLKEKLITPRQNDENDEGHKLPSSQYNRISEDDLKLDANDLILNRNKSGTIVFSDGKFICNYPNCGRTFTAIAYLKTHAFTHCDSKQNRCPYCENTYSQRRRLKDQHFVL